MAQQSSTNSPFTLYQQLVLRPRKSDLQPNSSQPSQPNNESSLHEFIKKVITFQENGQRLIDKFTPNFLLEYFDRHKIQQLEKLFEDNTRRMDIVQFSRFFLNAIEHRESETLYLAMNITDIFKELSLTNGSHQASLLDLTNYLCDKIVENDSQFKLQLKLLPPQKRIQASSLNSVRFIDKNAPLIHQRADCTLPKIIKGKTKTDKTSHTSGPISQIVYSRQLNKLLTLDTLSSSIKMFDTNLNFKKELVPSHTAKNSKDLAILSFAYSQKQRRIGCLVKDFGISFWEAADNFTTQKHISRATGQKIYFFELFQQWVITQGPRTHFWDIRQEKIKSTIQGAPDAVINSMCEIPFLRVICIAYSGKQQHKHLSLYRGKQQICRLALGHPGCHTVHYNKTTQVLIPIGYRITVPVYSIHPEFLDFTLVAQLEGHSSLVTCVADVQDSTVICTGDDTGIIRLWDLRTMRCVQVVKAARSINHLVYIDCSKMVFTDSRVNLMNFDTSSQKGMTTPNCLQSQSQSQSMGSLYPISAHFHADTGSFICATRQDVRIFCAKTGRLQDLYKLVVPSEEEISALTVCYGRQFLIATDQGYIKKFSRTGELISSMHAHSNQVTHISVDYTNQLLLSAGWDSDLFVWEVPTSSLKGSTQSGLASSTKRLAIGTKDSKDEHSDHSTLRKRALRSMKGGHFHKQICFVDTSVYHNLVVTGSRDNCLYLWDYEYSKLVAQIKLSSPPTSAAFIPIYPILVLGGSDSKIYFFKLTRKQLRLQIQLLLARECQDSVCKILPDYQYTSDEKDLKNCTLYLCMSNGKIQKLNISGLLKSDGMKKAENSVNRKNYNAFRNLSEDFQNEYNKNQFTKYQVPCMEAASPSDTARDKFPQLTQLSIRRQSSIASVSSNAETPHVRPSAYLVPSASVERLWLKDVHRDSINSASIFENGDRLLLTTSVDGSIRITRVSDGYILCVHNINHPLPLKWELKLDIYSQVKEKVLLSLKIIHSIFQKYEQSITVNESKYLSLKGFLNRLAQAEPPTSFITLPPTTQAPILLSDEYSPADMNPKYPKPSQPTLKQMEAYKRVYLSNNNKPSNDNDDSSMLGRKYHSGMRNSGSSPLLNSGSSSLFQSMSYDPRYQERQNIAELLDPNYFPKLMNKGLPPKTDYSMMQKQKNAKAQEPAKKFPSKDKRRKQTHQKLQPVTSKACHTESVDTSCLAGISRYSSSHYRQDFVEYAKSKNYYIVESCKSTIHQNSHNNSTSLGMAPTLAHSNTTINSLNYEARPKLAASLIALLNSRLEESKHSDKMSYNSNQILKTHTNQNILGLSAIHPHQ